MGYYLHLLMALAALALVGIVGAQAAPSPWNAVPLKQWTAGVTWDVNDDFSPPYGTWAETPEGVTVQGKAPLWSTRLLPGDQGAGQKVTVNFTVDKSSGAKRQLPGGCVRWGFHWGENSPGWDVGVVLRYQDPLNFYRVQISASRGELALWDSSGGFLQLIPVTVEMGKAHSLAITARGAHFQAALDGKKVLDYWDRTLPHLSGQAGLAAYQSEVRFGQFSLSPTPTETGPAPAHQPDFRLENTEGIRFGHPDFDKDTIDGVILFDGYEPIGYFWRCKNWRTDAQLMHDAIKLRPGWRPLGYQWFGPALRNDTAAPVKEKLPGAFKVEKEGETLVLRFRGEDTEIVADHLFTVSYDKVKGVCRYADQVQARYLTAQAAGASSMELVDPITSNNRMPGAGVINKWSPAGHRWWMYQGPGGQWFRDPLTDFGCPGTVMETDWPKFSDFLYPDEAACPYWEVELGWEKPEGQLMRLDQCLWGYDYHHTITGTPLAIPAGTERKYTLTTTALLPAEAKAIFLRSQLMAAAAANKEVYTVFDAAGTSFDKTMTAQDPTWTIKWDGTVDDAMGRTDKHSARIEGPGTAKAFMYQYAFEQHAKRWWVRGWAKSAGVTGRGLLMQVRYSYAQTPSDAFYLDGRGDRDWTYFSFITTAPRQRDCTSMIFELDGHGTVWLDDIAFSALQEGEEPKVTEFPLTAGLQPSTAVLLDLSMRAEKSGTVLDESNNGHTLFLKGPVWTQEKGRGFLRFNGAGNNGIIPLKTPLEPLDGPPGSEYKPIFPLKEFSYELWARPEEPPATTSVMWLLHRGDNPSVQFTQLHEKPGVCTLRFQNDQYRADEVRLETEVPYGQWLHLVATHGAGKVVLYVNGKQVGEQTYNPEGPGFAFFAYRWEYQVGTDNPRNTWYKGDLGPVRLYTKALTAEEVRERYEKGWVEVP